ncbi:MAG: hypothetical protein AB8E15_12225 [Bdellovibrionales bacterium]
MTSLWLAKILSFVLLLGSSNLLSAEFRYGFETELLPSAVNNIQKHIDWNATLGHPKNIYTLRYLYTHPSLLGASSIPTDIAIDIVKLIPFPRNLSFLPIKDHPAIKGSQTPAHISGDAVLDWLEFRDRVENQWRLTFSAAVKSGQLDQSLSLKEILHLPQRVLSDFLIYKNESNIVWKNRGKSNRKTLPRHVNFSHERDLDTLEFTYKEGFVQKNIEQFIRDYKNLYSLLPSDQRREILYPSSDKPNHVTIHYHISGIKNLKQKVNLFNLYILLQRLEAGYTSDITKVSYGFSEDPTRKGLIRKVEKDRLEVRKVVSDLEYEIRHFSALLQLDLLDYNLRIYDLMQKIIDRSPSVIETIYKHQSDILLDELLQENLKLPTPKMPEKILLAFEKLSNKLSAEDLLNLLKNKFPNNYSAWRSASSAFKETFSHPLIVREALKHDSDKIFLLGLARASKAIDLDAELLESLKKRANKKSSSHILKESILIALSDGFNWRGDILDFFEKVSPGTFRQLIENSKSIPENSKAWNYLIQNLNSFNNLDTLKIVGKLQDIEALTQRQWNDLDQVQKKLKLSIQIQLEALRIFYDRPILNLNAVKSNPGLISFLLDDIKEAEPDKKTIRERNTSQFILSLLNAILVPGPHQANFIERLNYLVLSADPYLFRADLLSDFLRQEFRLNKFDDFDEKKQKHLEKLIIKISPYKKDILLFPAIVKFLYSGYNNKCSSNY